MGGTCSGGDEGKHLWVTLQVGGECGSQSEACELGSLPLALRMICNVCVSNASVLCL